MLKILYNLFIRSKAKVGMKLGCKDFGREYTEIEVIKVSKNSGKFLYTFTMCKGKECKTSSTYSGEWPYILDVYNLLK